MSADPARREASAFQLAFYRFVRAAIAGFCRLFWRLEVHGRQNIPARGPFVLAPVHRSNVDTPLVAAATSRRLRFMGKDTMWKYGWSSWLFTSLGGFPVHRGSADREALRKCVAVIEAGEPVVIFPEGTRRSGPLVSDVFDGAAYVAARTGIPIVPVGIGGSEGAMPKGAKMLRPVKIVVVVGPPIAPGAAGAEGARVPRRAVRETTQQLRDQLQSLFDEARIMAGRR